MSRAQSIRFGILVSITFSAPLFAQQAESVDEVVVTGSRIARTGFETPTPLTTITPQELELKGQSTFVTMLAELPSLRPNQTTNLGRDVGASNLDLRSLGSQRTLALIDGRRIAPTSPAGGIDINILPQPLIRNVEIVTGGASAAYGSDAVSGVVNIFLDSKMTGLKFDGQAGQTQYGDGTEYSAALTYGRGFRDDRGHVVISAGRYENDGVLQQTDRPWGRDLWGLLANPTYTASNGQFRQFILPNTRNSRMTDGGVITAVPTGTAAAVAAQLVNVQFSGANGAQSAYQRGTNYGTVFMTGGDGARFGDLAGLAPRVERDNAFGRATWEFTSSLTGFAEVLYAKTNAGYPITPNYNSGDLVIQRDNAFLPANLRTIMTTNNVATFTMGRTNLDTFTNILDGTNKVLRTAVGLEGKLRGTWSWDTALQYSDNSYLTITYFNRNQANWIASVDSVIENGQTICRINSTLPANRAIVTAAAYGGRTATAGCAPSNVFGVNTVSAQAAAYVTGTSYVDGSMSEKNASFNLRGEPFSTWAGPVSLAVGGEYRKQEIASTNDALSEAQAWRSSNATAFGGEVDVKEGYLEIVAPLLKEKPLAELFELNGAVRATDYSTSGRVETWKIGLNYVPTSQLRLRATRSRDIRAPSISDLFTTGILRPGFTIIDPATNVQAFIQSISAGNPNLTPELADTLTFGAVYEPAWADGLRMSADVFDIQIKDALGTTTMQDVVDRCFRGETDFCPSIERNGAGIITLVRVSSYNAAELSTRGLDLEASYRFPISNLVDSWNGTLQLRSLATYVDSLETTNNGITTDTAGQVRGAGTPKWRVATTLGYANGPLNVRVLGNYIGGGKYDNAAGPLDYNDNTISSRFYVSTSANYAFSDHLQVYGRVENLFDKEPPVAPSTTIINNTASAVWYDRIGRVYSLGVRLKY